MAAEEDVSAARELVEFPHCGTTRFVVCLRMWLFLLLLIGVPLNETMLSSIFFDRIFLSAKGF